MTFFCIADRDSSPGFKLAAIPTAEPATREECLAVLNTALATEGIGVIIITEKAASLVREEIDSRLAQQQSPLILEIPSRGGGLRRKTTGELLKEAIGISI